MLLKNNLSICLPILLVIITAPVPFSPFLYAADAQLHFASIGNWGSGTPVQLSVAEKLKDKAGEVKLSFIVSPGSNFVSESTRIQSLEDRNWDTNFRSPYSGTKLYLPFFTVMGFEDWKSNHTALALKSVEDYSVNTQQQQQQREQRERQQEREKTSASKNRTETTVSTTKTTATNKQNPKWTLPNWWYHYGLHFQDASNANPLSSSEDVSLAVVFIDTYILSKDFPFANISKLHWDALKETVAAAVQVFDWTIVVGDKAIMSSGKSKGDAHLKKTLGKFLQDQQVDAYISGNDNDMEIITDADYSHINCGSGSRADKITKKARGSVAYVAEVGFCHHVVRKSTMTTELVSGTTGAAKYTFSQNKINRPRSIWSRYKIYKSLPQITYIPIPPIPKEDVEGTRKKAPQPGDFFVAILGTIGLLILLYMLILLAVTAASKFSKSA